jgi:hypothetical protein
MSFFIAKRYLSCFTIIVLFIPFFVFGFWLLLAKKLRKYEILRNLCLHLARQHGQDQKKWKENHETKVTKIPKTKNMG